MLTALSNYLDALTLTAQVIAKIDSNFLHIPLVAFAAGVFASLRK